MFPLARRYLLVIGLLLVGLALTWGARRQAAGVAGGGAGGPGTAAGGPGTAAGGPGTAAEETGVQEALAHLYFLDVEGWYRVTPYETVVRSPYDLTGGDNETLAAALPARVGAWEQVGH
ncbi:MAG: hypothetical protein PVJ34_00205, partial [Anaerolineae bacterium]